MASRTGGQRYSFATAAALVLTGAFTSCQGDAFNTSPDEPSAEAGAAGAGGSDTAGGSSGQGDGGEPEPVAGAAGDSAGGGGAASDDACVTSAECQAGKFCRQGRCALCKNLSDVSSVSFGNSQPLEVINGTVDQEGLRFPRPTGLGTGLLYVRDFFGGHLWHTSDPAKSAGATLPAPDDTFESGGLRVAFALPEPLTGYTFFFNRTDAEKKTRLYGAKLDAQGVVSGIEALPALFNPADVDDSYSIALSENRVIWTQNLDGALNVRLKTLPLPAGNAEPAELHLPLPDDCGFASEFEYAPWLTPDGKTLLFSARTTTTGCEVTTETPTRLYIVSLSELGEPLGPARALEGLAGEEASRQTDPALSADGCQLYYAAQPTNDVMGLYRAERLE